MSSRVRTSRGIGTPAPFHPAMTTPITSILSATHYSVPVFCLIFTGEPLPSALPRRSWQPHRHGACPRRKAFYTPRRFTPGPVRIS
jgi:hypothetical protein